LKCSCILFDVVSSTVRALAEIEEGYIGGRECCSSSAPDVTPPERGPAHGSAGVAREFVVGIRRTWKIKRGAQKKGAVNGEGCVCAPGACFVSPARQRVASR